MRKISIFIIIGVAIFSACNLKPKSKTSEDGEVVYRQPNDPKITEFQDTAQSHLPEFITSFEKNKGSKDFSFMVKSDYVEGDAHEHMWSEVTEINGDKFNGVLMDSAYDLKVIKMGDKVSVNSNAIEDWIIFDYKNDKQIGGFSVDYLKSIE